MEKGEDVVLIHGGLNQVERKIENRTRDGSERKHDINTLVKMKMFADRQEKNQDSREIDQG
jgi:hypothetical protein